MKKILRIFSNRDGNVAIPGAVFFVAVLALAGGSLDLMTVSNQKNSLQELADGAALAGVREMAITSEDVPRIKAIAKAFAESGTMEIKDITTSVDTQNREVHVVLTAASKSTFSDSFSGMNDLSASARARLSGKGGNICMIGLSPEAMSTLRLKSRAKISAESCAIYSNSKSASSMWVASTAEVKAELICVAGGYKGGAVAGNNSEDLRSTMVEDCVPVSDPLSMRVAPDVGTCNFTNTVVTGNQTLNPGVYCGGLIVDGGKATLNPGNYLLTDGPLSVENNGTLEGEHVGFFLSGPDAKLQFDYDSNIAISAPKEGLLTGLLLFSSPYETKMPEKTTQTLKRKTDGVKKPDHYIKSDNARRLVGTIYLPNGKLLIDGRRPIADRSEYTVIIADTFELQDGPNLVLRTDYHLSDIPVPEGVGPVADPQPILVE